MATDAFMAPGAYDADAEQIRRRMAYAQALTQQGQQPLQGQMVSGHFVAPSITQHLSNLLKTYGGRMGMNQAEGDMRALSDTRRQEFDKVLGAMRGTPAETIPPTTPNDDDGNPMPSATKAAVPGNMNAAMLMALKSYNPAVQAIGSNIMTNQMQAEMTRQKLADVLKQFGVGQPSAPAGAPNSPAASGATGATPATPATGTAGAPPAAGISGVNPLAFALTASGDPTFGKLGSMISDASKPIALREGDLVQTDAAGNYVSRYQQPKTDPGIVFNHGPNGQVISAAPIPGYAPANAAIAGAKASATEGAKAATDMVTIPTVDGPRMVTREQAIQMAGGPAPSTSGPTGNFVGSPQQIMSTISRIKDPTERANAFSAYAEQMARSGKKGIPLQDNGTSAFDSKMGTDQAETLTASHKSAKSAADDLMGIAEARKAIAGGVFQGSGANFKLAVAKFINANVPGVTVDAEKTGNSDYLKSTLGRGLLEQAKTLGSNPSNADAQRINDIVGDLTKDPNAMTKILDWRQGMAERAIRLHNTSLEQAMANGFKPRFDMRITQPTTKGGGWSIAPAN